MLHWQKYIATILVVGYIKFRLVFLLVGIVVFTTGIAFPARANHSWSGYHWSRTSNPFTLKLGSNLSSNWSPYLQSVSADWSVSSVLDTIVVPGATSGKRCRPTNGRVEVCNSFYGNNGWLGLAQIWINGDHITQGITKMNDTYFSKTQYNTVAWKNLVMCQEVGHTFGLGHQDETFDNPNLNTCMDYTNNPSTNQRPNQHDYDELDLIYSHLDNITTINSAIQRQPFGLSQAGKIPNSNYENRSEWGRELKNNGRIAQYERDFGDGNKLITSIIIAQ